MIETYLLKSSIALAIFYGAYYLLMRKSAHYQLNRLTGLVCILFSLVFLFFEFDPFARSIIYPEVVYAMVQQVSFLQGNLSSTMQSENQPLNLFLTIYWLGVIVFSIRFLWGLFSILRIYIISPKSYLWGFKVVITDKAIPPFTFFNLLFISNKALKKGPQEAIIIHEQHHRDQWHSLDTLLLELLTIVFWFNPFMWFFQKAIRASHEYMADQQVLKMGIDPLDYQQLLFENRTGVTLQLGSSLNNGTSLKKRFTRMLNPQNQIQAYWRVLCFIPLMIALLTFNSFAQSNTQVKTLTKAEEKQLMEQIRQLEKIVYDAQMNNKQLALNSVKMPVKYPVYILEKQRKKYKVSPAMISKISLNTIADVHVLKGKKAIDAYGSEAKNGVVIIRLKE
ncbi:hypothetical protein BKI52_13475 [marine bacterium AO1-C]|nr:hypothetical protein BKI52_13475 [marine bacterium AO1-C]